MDINILVVDDEKEIADLVEIYLVSDGYTVFKANNAEDGLAIIEKEEIHLAILDIMMPGMDGLEMCKKIREKHNFPIILLSAKSADIDKILGLGTGADDYVTKPFNMNILLRRVEVALRRGKKEQNTDKNQWSDGFLLLDFKTLTAVRGKERLPVTPNEYKLLKVLTENAGNILPRKNLLEQLWDAGGNFIDDHTLTVTMNRLRGKIEDEAHTYIQTVRGMGYIWTGGAQ